MEHMLKEQSEGRSAYLDNRTRDLELIEKIREYWNSHIHDLSITSHPVGSKEFFDDLENYRFDKLHYLPRIVDFSSYRGKHFLEVGCGVGIDLVRFAEAGAEVVGIDLAQVSIDLAEKNFEHNRVSGDLRVMDGEELEYEDNTFDAVYAHGVIQYTANADFMINEICRVLKPGGEAILMVYNRNSWLNLMSKVMKVELEHEDAPVLKKYAISEFKKLLQPFERVRIIPERFPVKTRLHKGLKAKLYNGLFVNCFNLIPNAITRPTGWHLMAFAYK